MGKVGEGLRQEADEPPLWVFPGSVCQLMDIVGPREHLKIYRGFEESIAVTPRRPPAAGREWESEASHLHHEV